MGFDKQIKSSRINAFVAIAIAVGVMLIDKFLSYKYNVDYKEAVMLTMVAVFMAFLQCLLIYKNKSPFYAVLSALVSCKMIPKVSFLEGVSEKAYLLYFFVSKVIFVIFILLIVNKFMSQSKSDACYFRVLVVAVLITALPFTSGIYDSVYSDLYSLSGNMMLLYGTKLALYLIGVVAIFATAIYCGKGSMLFTGVFQCIASGVNIFSKAAFIGIMVAQGVHISKANYVWLAAYIVIYAVSVMILNKVKRQCLTPKKEKV